MMAGAVVTARVTLVTAKGHGQGDVHCDHDADELPSQRRSSGHREPCPPPTKAAPSRLLSPESAAGLGASLTVSPTSGIMIQSCAHILGFRA